MFFKRLNKTQPLNKCISPDCLTAGKDMKLISKFISISHVVSERQRSHVLLGKYLSNKLLFDLK